MKKIVVLILVIIIILSFNSNSFGFSNDIFSIDVPNYFLTSSNIAENNTRDYTLKSDKINIIITVVPYNNKKNIEITKEYIKNLSLQVKASIEEDFNINLDLKETKVASMGKGYYKCGIALYESKEYKFYIKQYSCIISDNYTYSITLTTNDKNNFYEEDILELLNSFTIKDTIGEKNKNKLNNSNKQFFEKIIVTSVSTIIMMGIGAFIKKFKNDIE